MFCVHPGPCLSQGIPFPDRVLLDPASLPMGNFRDSVNFEFSRFCKFLVKNLDPAADRLAARRGGLGWLAPRERPRWRARQPEVPKTPSSGVGEWGHPPPGAALTLDSDQHGSRIFAKSQQGTLQPYTNYCRSLSPASRLASCEAGELRERPEFSRRPRSEELGVHVPELIFAGSDFASEVQQLFVTDARTHGRTDGRTDGGETPPGRPLGGITKRHAPAVQMKKPIP